MAKAQGTSFFFVKIFVYARFCHLGIVKILYLYICLRYFPCSLSFSFITEIFGFFFSLK